VKWTGRECILSNSRRCVDTRNSSKTLITHRFPEAKAFEAALAAHFNKPDRYALIAVRLKPWRATKPRSSCSHASLQMGAHTNVLPAQIYSRDGVLLAAAWGACTSMRLCTHTHTHSHTLTHDCTHTYIHTHTYMHTHTHARTYTHVQSPKLLHTVTPASSHTSRNKTFRMT
jgi:hypothetical protein